MGSVPAEHLKRSESIRGLRMRESHCHCKSCHTDGGWDGDIVVRRRATMQTKRFEVDGQTV